MQETRLTYDELYAQNIRLKDELETLRRFVFGQKRERFIPTINSHQISLLGESDEQPSRPVIEKITYKRKKAQKKHTPHGRNKLPDNLPRHRIIIEPKEDVSGLKKIGEEITEELELISAKLYVKQYVRPKYAKPRDEGVIIAELPSRPIEKCIAGASLLSHIQISKYVDHQPLYRQIQILKRLGVRIPASTMSGWVQKSGNLLVPLYHLQKDVVLQTDYVQADETIVKVLDPLKKGTTHTGYYWPYHDPIRRLLFFDYRPGRSRAGPCDILKNFKGYLQTDGYASYNEIVRKNDLIRLGCMAHVRRKYFDALKSAPEPAKWMLQRIADLYAIEHRARENKLTFDERFQLRKQYARPILKSMKKWLDTQITKILPASTIGKAVSYMLNQWPRLINYLLDGRLEIDNNLTENSIRPIALGRKNWLFAGSHQGAANAAIIYTLVGTAKLHNIEPFSYLKDVFDRINDHPFKYLDELLPQNWLPRN